MAPKTGMVSITMASSAGYMTPAGTPAFLHGYNLQLASELDTIIFRDGSTGSGWATSPVTASRQQSGSDNFTFVKSNSPWFEDGIYCSFAGTRIVSIGYEYSQGLSS